GRGLHRGVEREHDATRPPRPTLEDDHSESVGQALAGRLFRRRHQVAGRRDGPLGRPGPNPRGKGATGPDTKPRSHRYSRERRPPRPGPPSLVASGPARCWAGETRCWAGKNGHPATRASRPTTRSAAAGMRLGPIRAAHAERGAATMSGASTATRYLRVG